LPDDHVWTPASQVEGQLLAAIDGAAVGEEVSIHVDVGARTAAGHRRFRVWLEAAEHGRSLVPVISGQHPVRPDSGDEDSPAPPSWLEVTHFEHQLPMSGGTVVEVPAEIDRRIVSHLGSLVPAGGHLVIEYDSPGRRMTARALLAGVPAVATPLGAALFDAGCGVVVRDWGDALGGRAGARRLQGSRALHSAHAEQRAREMLPALQRFLAESGDLEWDMQAATRAVAQEAVVSLQQRLRIAAGLRANVL
jgi:hypothetical protein